MKILVIRFSSIGDIVITTPVIRCLKKQLNAQVHFATKSKFSSILKFNPYIEKYHYLNEQLDDLVSELKEEKFDLIVDLHNSLRSRLIRNRLGVKSYSFQKLNLKKALLVGTKINLLPEKHLIDRYFEGVRDLGIKNDLEGMDFFIDPDVKSIENPKSDRFICIALGGTYFTKRMPKEKWLELVEKVNGQIFLLGGPDDVEVAKWMERKSNRKLNNLCGLLSIQESAKVISQSDVVLSGDTGMMHIAAALQKPLISIWGNTVPNFGMFPYFGTEAPLNFKMEVPNLACRPCSKLGKDVCPKGHFRCMIDQDVEMIVKNIRLVLEMNHN